MRAQSILLSLKHGLHFIQENHKGTKLPEAKKTRENRTTPTPESKELFTITPTILYNILRKFHALRPSPESSLRENQRILLAQVVEARQVILEKIAYARAKVLSYVQPLRYNPERNDEVLTSYARIRAQEFEGPSAISHESLALLSLNVFHALKRRIGSTNPRFVLQELPLEYFPILEDLTAIAHSLVCEREKIHSSPEVWREFHQLLKEPGPKAPLFELLTTTRWLDLLFPEYSNARSHFELERPETEALSRHLLNTVAELDRLMSGDAGALAPYEEQFGGMKSLFIRHPWVLYLAGFAHDIGRPATRTHKKDLHEIVGAEIAQEIGKRLTPSSTKAFRCGELVARHHYLPRSSRATWPRSLHERREVMAQRMKDPDFLTMSFLLATADMSCSLRPIPPTNWEWLARMYCNGLTAMGVTLATPPSSHSPHTHTIRKAVQYIRAGSLNSILPSNVEESLTQHIGAFRDEYEVQPDELAHHCAGVQIARENPSSPYFQWMETPYKFDEDNPRTHRSERLIVVAKDQQGLLSSLFGAIEFNIREARIFTRSDGFACNVITCDIPLLMFISDLNGRILEDITNSFHKGSEQLLQSIMALEADVAAATQPAAKLSYSTELDTHGSRPTLTVKGPDRPRLAWLMSTLIAQCGGNILEAKFSGSGTRIQNTFLLERFPPKVLPQFVERLNALSRCLPLHHT